MPFITGNPIDFGNEVIAALHLRDIRWKKTRISGATIEAIRTAIDRRANNPIKVEAISKRHKCIHLEKDCVTFESLVVTPSEENGLAIDLSAEFGNVVDVKLKISFFFKPVIRGSLIHNRCPEHCKEDDPDDSAHNITVEVILRGALTLEGGFVLLGRAGRIAQPVRVSEISYSDFDLSAVGAPASPVGDGENAAANAGSIKAGVTVEFIKSLTCVIPELKWQPEQVEAQQPVMRSGRERNPSPALRKKRRRRR